MEIRKYSLEVQVYKTGEMVFFSQLDLLKVLSRALRRTNLPLYFTQGFSPHVKISFRNGLKLGVQGRVSTVFYFSRPISFPQLSEILQPQLPRDLKVLPAD